MYAHTSRPSHRSEGKRLHNWIFKQIVSLIIKWIGEENVNKEKKSKK